MIFQLGALLRDRQEDYPRLMAPKLAVHDYRFVPTEKTTARFLNGNLCGATLQLIVNALLISGSSFDAMLKNQIDEFKLALAKTERPYQVFDFSNHVEEIVTLDELHRLTEHVSSVMMAFDEDLDRDFNLDNMIRSRLIHRMGLAESFAGNLMILAKHTPLDDDGCEMMEQVIENAFRELDAGTQKIFESENVREMLADAERRDDENGGRSNKILRMVGLAISFMNMGDMSDESGCHVLDILDKIVWERYGKGK
jgi:hypothetical protein